MCSIVISATAAGGVQPGESVVLGPDAGVEQVNATYINAGQTIAYGTDMGFNYTYKTSNIGRFSVRCGGDVPLVLQASLVPGAPMLQYVDQTTDGEGQDAYLRWKGTAQVDWSLGGYKATLFGHYINGFHDFDLNGDDRRVGSSVTWDLQFSYTVHEEFSAYLKDTTITVGAFNLFDRDPPLSQYFGNNPNNYPGFIYTSEGRMWYVSLDKRF